MHSDPSVSASPSIADPTPGMPKPAPELTVPEPQPEPTSAQRVHHNDDTATEARATPSASDGRPKSHGDRDREWTEA